MKISERERLVAALLDEPAASARVPSASELAGLTRAARSGEARAERWASFGPALKALCAAATVALMGWAFWPASDSSSNVTITDSFSLSHAAPGEEPGSPGEPSSKGLTVAEGGAVVRVRTRADGFERHTTQADGFARYCSSDWAQPFRWINDIQLAELLARVEAMTPPDRDLPVFP
ncbi:MAG: hypothetical protein ACFB20_03230 [Opitutales bacterium]